jgi:hypothetical protein
MARAERMGWLEAAAGGLAGALATTLLHETARRRLRTAPRMDVLGRRGLTRTLARAGVTPPRGRALQRWTLVAELLSNAAYYALVAAGRRPHRLARGAALGTAAGAGAIVLPGPLGLGTRPSRRTPATAAMAFSWYLGGGLAAGAAARAVARGVADVADRAPHAGEL